VGDNADIFPFDFTETIDSDLDGIGDNTDAFPFNANETVDTDGDGVGDNAQAIAEAKAAKLAAEQSELYMLIGIAVVVIILTLAMVVALKKRKGVGETVTDSKQYGTPVLISHTQQIRPQPLMAAAPLQSGTPRTPPHGRQGVMRGEYEVIEYPEGSGSWWWKDPSTSNWNEWS
ncbi:MAG TPA: hypothetical protein EYQ58_05665, partial [Candidatus Poseidoniales archaeon]|nr:hypothetical protein [Candidatus Poseidoniales archaeon]